MNGEYDSCEKCKGARVVAVVDESRCNKKLLKLYHKHEREEAEYQQMCRSEFEYCYGID